MKTKLILTALIIFSILSNLRGQSKGNCNNLRLDTTTFYIFPQQDTLVQGKIHYMDTTMTFYPILRLLLADTSLITSPNIIVLSYLDSGIVEPYSFKIKFKTATVQNNTVVKGLFHIYDSDWPGDSTLSCYLPITIVFRTPTGIAENHKKNGAFRLYPNPADKNTTLEFENPESADCTLTIYDPLGRPVETITGISTNKVEIERKKLPNGFYFFQLHTDRQIMAQGKLILE